MGAYIVSLAYNHNFDITSDQNFANDISKRFSASLTMFTDESNKMGKYEILSIERKDAKRNISITKCTPSTENTKLYIVDFLENYNVFEVFTHHVDLSLMNMPLLRWCDLERSIREKNNLNLLHTYRVYIKNLCDIMGCNICLYFSDEDETEILWEESLKNYDYNSIMEYIEQKHYIRKPCEEDIRGILNLSGYLMNDQCIIDNWFYFIDVIIDDFNDLK